MNASTKRPAPQREERARSRRTKNESTGSLTPVFPYQKLTLNPTHDAWRKNGRHQHEPPTAEVSATIAAELLMLKKSTCVRFALSNLNALERRRSAVVTVGSRSSPRALRKTFWLPRVSATTDATAARDAEYVET